MLAYPFEEKRLSKWEPPYIIQPKLDGDRCRAVFDAEGHVTLLSSEENPIDSVPHITQELEAFGLTSFELDGELYKHGEAHQLLHGIISRTVNLHPDFEMIEYHVFDYISSQLQGERTMHLEKMLTSTKYIKKVPSLLASSLDDIMKIMSTYTAQGYEGIIIRNIMAPYVRKRSTGMMKFKPRRNDMYTIIGYEEEIDQYGSPKNVLGALVLKSDQEQVFKVGTGSFLTRDHRESLWQEKDKLIGRIAEVAYQHLTERQVPRFPVLLNILEIK
jgi:ATP-dependent DNA ligase